MRTPASVPHSTLAEEYVIRPPDLPQFMFGTHAGAWRELIAWTREEYKARLEYCTRRSYFREHAYLTRNYSPLRILAEMSGFRRFCAYLGKSWGTWNDLSRAERKTILKAMELREFLLKSPTGRRFDD